MSGVQVAGFRCTGCRFQEPGVQVPGARFQVSGSGFQVSDARLQVSSAWFHVHAQDLKDQIAVEHMSDFRGLVQH